MSIVDGECKDYGEIAYAEEGGSEIKTQKKTWEGAVSETKVLNSIPLEI